MKISTSVYFSDLIPVKKTFVEASLKKISKNDILNKQDPTSIFKRLKMAGIDGIEFILPLRFSDLELQYVKEILNKNKITVLSIHEPIKLTSQTSIVEIEKICKTAQQLSTHVVVLHIQQAANQIFQKNYFEALRDYEKKYQLTFGFENHQKHFLWYSKQYLWDSSKFSQLMKDTPFHITLDTTHLAQSKGDILTFFKQNKERIVNIHLSDYSPHFFSASLFPFSGVHRPLGDGKLPIFEFIKLLKTQNYKGLVTLEVNDSLDKICESIKYLKSSLSHFSV